MSMITATTWVPRGFAAPFPKKYDVQEDEYDRIAELARLKLEDAKEDLEEAEEAETQSGKGKEQEKGESSNGATGVKSQG
jgi:periodic tryptophan protein 1